MNPLRVSVGLAEYGLADTTLPLPLDRLVAGRGAWELELGFGKGRYLLERAERHPERRFLGAEVAGKYYRLARQRAIRRGLRNLLLVRTEALYLTTVVLPRRFAAAVHVYFPDPWPKARHHRRRLFDAETVDLVLDLLRPGGRLLFATDHQEYGARVANLLENHPRASVRERRMPWEDGPRTNYEGKYMAEGRPIVRLEVEITGDGEPLHPAGAKGITSAWAPPPED